MPQKKLKSCFIVAPTNLNIDPLRNLLKNRQINVLDISNIELSKINFTLSIEKVIRKADFICVIITKQYMPNIFYEFGLARGAKKPIFLIYEDEQLPISNFFNITYVRASINDTEAISINLDIFLSNYRKRSEYYYPGKKYQKKLNFIKSNQERSLFFYPSKEYVKKLKDISSIQKELEILRSNGYEKDLEDFMEKIFKQFDDVIVVKKKSYSKEEAADFSLWIDGLESIIGNPVLVEIKMGNITKSNLIKTENQIRDYLIKIKAPLGLIIYLDRRKKHFKNPKIKYPLVIWFELHNLISSLSTNSLTKVIANQRNKLIHSINEGEINS